MEEFKNLKEIIELCRAEIYTDDRNIHATLGFEELKELQCLLDNYNVHKRSNEMLLTQKREQEKIIELMAKEFAICGGFDYVEFGMSTGNFNKDIQNMIDYFRKKAKGE